MEKIGIIGSGNVGANTAFFLAERSVADVVLFDIQDGLSKGKALDMMEVAPIRAYRSEISGTDSMDDVLDSGILIITAGAVRKPGMKREDLFEVNREVMKDLAARLSRTDAVVIIVTEPVDLLTTTFIRESGLPAERVMGLGGVLDSSRLRFLIARELRVSMENVGAMVIGRHSDEMIPLPDYCCVSGIPVTSLIGSDRLNELFEETRRAGSLIVDMAQRANAYYGPSAVAADLAETIVKNNRKIVSVSTMFDGQYGIRGVSMSLPCVVGSSGIVRVLEPRLSDEQKETLDRSAETIRRVTGE